MSAARDCVVVAPADLVRRDKSLDLDKLVAGRDDRDLRGVGHGHGGMPARGGNRDLTAREPDARPHDDVARPVIGAPAMDEAARSGRFRGQCGNHHQIPLPGRLLVGHDAIGAVRQHGSRHDLDAGVIGRTKLEGPHSRSLRRLHPEPRDPSGERRRAQREPVHRHPVERRDVPVRPQVAAKHPAVRLRDRAVLPVKERDRVEDQLLCAGGCEHGASIAHKSLLAKITISYFLR